MTIHHLTAGARTRVSTEKVQDQHMYWCTPRVHIYVDRYQSVGLQSKSYLTQKSLSPV